MFRASIPARESRLSEHEAGA